MSVTLVLAGTRKGCFVLESDAERHSWKQRGPYCENWPIYHAVHDADSGALYAAAASEWHGAGVWRSHDLGETWELSSDGLSYGEDGELKLSKVSGLSPSHGRLLAGGEGCGVFESRDGARTWSLLSTLDDQPGREAWNIPTNQPPGHLGLPGLLPAPRRTPPASGRWSRASASSRRPTTVRRGRRATAGCAPTGRSRIPRSATACTSS